LRFSAILSKANGADAGSKFKLGVILLSVICAGLKFEKTHDIHIHAENRMKTCAGEVWVITCSINRVKNKTP
jgi:hypothetical protein